MNTTAKLPAGAPRRSAASAIAMIGVMTAVTCILGPLSIPIGPVPISLTHIAIFLAVYALGMKYGTVSYLVYMLIGLMGLPVFSGGAGGPAKLFGATGGYLFGFIFMALIAGWFIDHFDARLLHLLGMVLGAAVCYLFGTIWFVRIYTGADGGRMSFSAALAICVYPFLIGDLIKMLICLIIGPLLKKQLKKARLRR